MSRRRSAFSLRFGDEPRRDLDEPPPQRLLLHDPDVVLDVRRGRDDVEERADVVLPARGGECSLTLELVGERQRVEDRTGAVQGEHRPEDPAVCLAIEHRLVHQFDGAHDGIGVEQHGAQHRLFRVLRIRGTAVTKRITRRRRYRKLDGRAGHLPRWGASTTDCGGARRGGR